MLSALKDDLKLFLSLILISAVFIIFDNFNLLNFPKSLLQQVTIPIQYGLYKTSVNIGKQFEFVLLSRRAAQENKALTEQLASVLSENSQLRQKLAEIEGFLEQQNSLDAQTFNLVPVRPLGFSRFLIIDKGSDEGIKVNQAVIFKDNFIGLIKEVSPKKSKVMLSSDPDLKISVFASNETGKAKGVLSGQFGSEMIMDKVLHQEPLEVEDLIYTDGQEVEIPRGLILGKVAEVLSKDNEVFKQAKVKPIFDVTDLEILFVVIE